jgi:hypothetical protein
MDIVLALGAALLFGVGTVLHDGGDGGARRGGDEGRPAGAAGEAARLAGIVADALGFVLQAVALVLGRVVVVQPLLATAVGVRVPLRRPARPPPAHA